MNDARVERAPSREVAIKVLPEAFHEMHGVALAPEREARIS